MRPYKNFYKDASVLYPGNTVYGPYTRKSDGRRIVVIYDGVNRTGKLYAKVKLEIKLGRRLSRYEEVDHVDEDFTNDRFSNLQLLSPTANRSKSADAGLLVRYSRSVEGRAASSKKMKGVANPCAKFSSAQVVSARKIFDKYRDLDRVCEFLNAPRKAVRGYLSGNSYSDVGGPTFSFSRIPGTYRYLVTRK